MCNTAFLQLFDGSVKHGEHTNLSELQRSILDCEWTDCFKQNIFQQILQGNAASAERSELLSGAIAALLAFIQQNFVGPSISFLELDFPGKSNVGNLLKSDGEDLNVNIRSPELLYVCKLVFNQLISIEEEDVFDLSERIWYLRYLILYQRCLDDLTHSIYSMFDRNVEIIAKTLNEIDNQSLKIQIHIEILQGYILFKRITKSERWMKEVLQLAGIELTVEGVLGVRTKYQKNPLPQLTLRVKGLEQLDLPSSEHTNVHIQLPTILKLEDDLRLDRIKFTSEQDNTDAQLPSLIQAMVFSKLLLLIHSQPKDKLADEELEPYITSLLYQEFGPWATRTAVLFLNINQEANHKRTVDRSLKQCEELVHLMDSEVCPVAHRLSHAFISALIPRWKIKAKLGDLLVSLGMFKGALNLYLDLQIWEDVIACYNILELRHKAAEIIQQEIDKKPTVTLYCLLGDATDDIQCYRKAWESSGETSARAQRHWGNFYFARKQYVKAIPHLKKSIEINCLQESTLLRLGYAALQLEQWEEAAKAYRLYTSLESHGFESWNNLAKAYIKLGEKNRAHKILQEAIKCNFNNWKVWDNYLVVSVDTKNYEDALNAYERLMELKDKFYDQEVLEILTKVVSEGAPDANGNSSHRLTKKMLKLLGYACAKIPNNGNLYELSSRLETEDCFKKAQKLQSAYRCYTQSNSQWSKDANSCRKIIELCIELCASSLKAFLDGKEDAGKLVSLKSQLSSARLTGQGCLRAASNENWEPNTGLIEELNQIVQKLTVELTNIMNK
ncbi:tetratricopeptide repeat protein 27 [Toxorhynchites rutilus septentrionalis]|uniref:tetratricopeptide repeat protein 27 n=1 Tax=Toxorhynchites rutilus septentrionalis TaxID=329112 RepID=UPI00247B184B|nr:tetratricopeptide repeat protein 27 [Toxorhynchites rutilus septentrionalis]